MDGPIRRWCRPKFLRRNASTNTNNTVHLALVHIGALGRFGDADDDKQSTRFVLSPANTAAGSPAIWDEERAPVKS